MILSVSRRTDIPAFYSEWFFNRIKAGYVDVRNPMSIHQVSRVSLNPDAVDCIVFWSKNPKPMLARLDELKEYKYYFQYTINPYDKQIEAKVPAKANVIETFRKLAEKIGSKNVIWRYDPILLTEQITTDYHKRYFEELAKRLTGYTERCVISFVDLYKNTQTNTRPLGLKELSSKDMEILAAKLAQIAGGYGMEVVSCAESIDLKKQGIEHGCCIDRRLVEEICDYKIDVKKDKNQRKECGCVESIDIGAYNTCPHACAYCYANFNTEKVESQSQKHIPTSSLLIGELGENDVVKERKVKSLKAHMLF